MKKKAFIAMIAVSLVLVSLVEMPKVKIGKANPVPFPSTPNKEPPSLVIVNPQNYSAINASSFLLNFTVTKPDSWNKVYFFPYIGEIKSVEAFLDGNLCPQTDIRGNNDTSFSISLNQLTSGLHEANVTVLSYTYYTQLFLDRPNIYANITDNNRPIYAYPIVVSDTVFFTVDASSPTATPSPTPSSTTTWLTIDLADHNYMNNVPVGQPVYFSAAVSNGIAPYQYLWKFRPYYVGTAVGDFYPTGDWIEGAATQNFTFTPNSTGSYLIEVKVWDSAGSEGLFMSLPPGIWIHAANSTPAQTPSPTPTPQPMLEVIDVVKLRNFGGFYGAAYDSGTNEVYIANVDFDLVSVVSASNRKEVKEIPVGKQPLGVAYDSGKGEIFVANYASNSVSVISDSNHTVVATISVGNHPTALAYDWGKGEVFVVNRDDNTVSVISDGTNTVVATIPVGKTPYGIAYAATGKVYVTNRDDNTVSVISDSTNTVVATVQVGVNPYHAVYDWGKGEIFVTNNNSSSVSVISDSTNAMVANITVGSMPMGLAYDSGRGLIFVGNYGDNSVSVISDETNTVIDTIAPQQQPFALAYDSKNGQIFVAHMESWSVSVISDSSNPSSSPATTATASPSTTPDPSTSSTPTEDGGSLSFALGIAVAAMIAIVAGLLVVLAKRRVSE